ncbi:m7GpppX diphosphatase-like isoform X2 [Phymastichus coffea]|uniref:m7GpppX diphosphatase-like isoform X2 n=1 Tax=Phymastichus coffea TaxID=108790 RepID=UPI00273B6780|nr:m7GpppX diphosphatase-like isoform X2 [Phymastichus coffea]
MTNYKGHFDEKAHRFIKHSRKGGIHQNVKKQKKPWTKIGEFQAKKAKESTKKVSVHHKKLIDLSDFRPKRMLDFNMNKKEIIMEGKFVGYEGPAIVIFEKKMSKHWPLLEMEFFNKKTFTKQVSINDVYGDYICFPRDDMSGWKMRIIHPASQKHLDKYTKIMENVYLVNETYETYEKITRPYVESEALSVQWINDILNDKAERDHIIHNDDDEEIGFVMLPDLKWNGSLENLNLIIISRKNITSLRDLNETHLPLLKNIRDVGTSIMKNIYDLVPSQFKMTVHYQPTYYHFHVLVSKLMFKSQGEHLLSTESHLLYKKYQDSGIIISNEVEVSED